jgi:hypothetical protein
VAYRDTGPNHHVELQNVVVQIARYDLERGDLAGFVNSTIEAARANPVFDSGSATTRILRDAMSVLRSRGERELAMDLVRAERHLRRAR